MKSLFLAHVLASTICVGAAIAASIEIYVANDNTVARSTGTRAAAQRELDAGDACPNARTDEDTHAVATNRT
jgi:hypothetical protein